MRLTLHSPIRFHLWAADGSLSPWFDIVNPFNRMWVALVSFNPNPSTWLWQRGSDFFAGWDFGPITVIWMAANDSYFNPISEDKGTILGLTK